MKTQITLFAILIVLLSWGKISVANVTINDTDNEWNPNPISFFLEEEDEVLRVEEWMQNDDFWNEKETVSIEKMQEQTESKEEFVLTVEEESMKVENWMLDDNFWN